MPKSKSSLVVTEMRSGDPGEPFVGDTGSIAVAVLDAKTDRLADRQGSQVLVGLLSWRQNLNQNVDCGKGGGVLHQRQIDEILNGAVPEQWPDSLVFALHLLLCRVGGPLDTDMPEVIETKSNRTATKIEGRGDIHAQACDKCQFDYCRGAIA